MCEIAVVDPEQTDVQSVFQLASTLYEEQGDGLGVVAVSRNEEENKFEYNRYKSTQPAWQSFWSFLRRNAGQTWRFILHARAMTDGAVNRQNTHPLSVNCEKCDTDWMVHNGVARNHHQIRGGLTTAGHTFETDVDSEVIAHKHEEIPDSLDNIEDEKLRISGSLNYILASEDKILAHFEQKYHSTDDFVVTCSTRKRKEPFSDIDEMENDSEWILATPDGEIEHEERKIWRSKSKYRGWGANRRKSTAKNGRGGSSISSKNKSSADTDSDNESNYVTEVYDDLLPKVPGVEAYKVAPGVIKIREGGKDGREDYVKRRDEPALYSYYATGEAYPGDSWLDFIKMVDEEGKLKSTDELEQATLREKREKLEEEVVHDESQRTINEVANNEDFR